MYKGEVRKLQCWPLPTLSKQCFGQVTFHSEAWISVITISTQVNQNIPLEGWGGGGWGEEGKKKNKKQWKHR